MSAKLWVAVAVALVVVIGVVGLVLRPDADDPVRRGLTFADVVPAPVSSTPSDATFVLADGASIVTSPAAAAVGQYLAAVLGRGTAVQPGQTRPADGIALLLDPGVGGGSDGGRTNEAYELTVEADGVTVRAPTTAGLYWGVQTLRQLIPPSGHVVVPGGRIADQPRFGYRSVMLDVSRHFFDVDAVKRVIDLSTMYKVNHLHLHLSDDQGWRIAIPSWPRLAEYGGGTEVGDGPGGFYTAEQYQEIVAYAADRFMTVVPEIDLPGHTNAALASYPELNCDGQAKPRYTGIQVGFSALCPNDPDTERFLTDVLGELARLTPGQYLHIGGDEASTLSAADYAAIVTRAQAIVGSLGKTVIGWNELANAPLSPGAVLQYWEKALAAQNVYSATRAGHKVIMSPADRAYLDQKYDSSTRIGLSWAGPTSVEKAYDWDPATLLQGVDESAVLGVESPLWTETVTTVDDIEYLAFPRLVAIAEIGWSPVAMHDWAAFRNRLGAQAPRWSAMGVNFAPADGVPWVV
jgi:hexosaminidase